VSLRSAAPVIALLVATGCATTAEDPRDPLEGYNRAMFAVNDTVDWALFKPVARAYKWVTPAPLRGMVRNFFANLEDPFIGVNNMLQGKFLDGWGDWARFAFNTVFGVLGINDVASEMGLEKHNEDFGQTFGVWGAGDGAYLVLPFFGPSTLRDTGGLVLDLAADPVSRHRPVDESNAATAMRIVSRRADLLDASRVLEEAAFDKYLFMRDAYLQRRRSLIYDGRPPRERRVEE
jgi:phospholipid-binding lipoprotein MlaA